MLSVKVVLCPRYLLHLSHLPVLHAEGIHINDACLTVAQDVVELHVEPVGLLPEHTALRLHVLQLVRQSLHVVLHLLHLGKKQPGKKVCQRLH